MSWMPSKTELCLLAVAALTLALVPVLETSAEEAAPEPPPPVTFHPSVQERARFELLPDKTFTGDGAGAWQIGNRARLGMEARFGGHVSVFVQLQDVRTWGSEYNAKNLGEGTLFDWVANGLDVHQGWGQINLPGAKAQIRIGRQEIAWHGQRLIGSVLWAHQGRSFDAIRFSGEPGKFGFDVFYAMLLNRPVDSTDTSNRWEDGHLVALRAGPRLGDPLALDGVFIANIDQGTDMFLTTFGVHAKGKAGAFAYEVEGYGQAGKGDAVTHMAYLVGLRAGATIAGGPNPYIGGGFDVVSGDKDPTDDVVRTFDTLYATNHKFYGHLDAYLALPKHTRGAGLIDGQLNTKFKLSKKAGLGFDAHVFASPSPADGDSAFHGLEFDVNGKVKPWKPLTLSAGVWVYVPGAFWGDDVSPEVGAYLSTDFQLK